MRKLKCGLFAVLVLGCAGLFGAVGYLQQAMPDSYTVARGTSLHIGSLVQSRPLDRTVSAAAETGESYDASLQLFGLVPIKSVSVSVTDGAPVVVVCGTPFGIKLYTDGVLVVGLSDVVTAAGSVNPAAAAGICVGDTILSADGEAVTTNRELADRINASGGRPMTLRVRRDGIEFFASFTPARPAEGNGWRAGLWVRDSTAGIGMLTFYDPATGAYGGLGHAVCDADTGGVMAISGGEIVPARIYGVEKSVKGTPGELRGTFELGSLGNILRNGSDGLFGQLRYYPIEGRSLPVAMRQEVHTGAAQLLTTAEGTRPALYDITIEQVRSGGSSARNMVIRITDKTLLEKTGGVVQGMSGSPILQDGKLVGAVTHVLVNDPTKGYAIFAENMLETAKSAAEQPWEEAS